MSFDARFLASLVSIILINIALSGDNAVVIAMAARMLPKDKRRAGILLGSGAAVVVRVVATIFVAQLLQIPFVKLVGGVVILWVALKLFTGGGAEEHADDQAAKTVWEAVKIIVVADISMGLDNMLAVAGAAEGHMGLLIFGLALSIPLVVFASDLLARLMDRFPVIIYIGAGILGRVGGDMIITDPKTVAYLHPSPTLVYTVEGTLAAAVMIAGWLIHRRLAEERAAAAKPAERRSA